MKILLILTLLSTGCVCPLQQPAEKVSDFILPEYIEYVKNDPKFKMKPDRQQRRIDAAKSFKEAVDAGRSK